MTSQGLMPARNAGLSSHRPGKLDNSKWPLSKFSRAMTTKTSIPRGHQSCDVIMHKVYWKDTEIGYLPHSTRADTLFSNNLLKSFYSSSRKYFSDKRQFRQAFIKEKSDSGK